MSILALLMASCGFADDDADDDAIAELDDALTVAPDEEEGTPSGTPEPPDLSPELASPEVEPVEELPPGISEDATPDASPDAPTPELDIAATPDGIEEIGPAMEGTPDADDEFVNGAVATPDGDEAAVPQIGDGTGGVQVEDQAAEATDTDDGTPVATPEPEGEESLNATGVVESCEPVEVPAFTGVQSDGVVADDVNFRVGPGEDCDVLPASPLLAGDDIVLTSDPVLRAEQDELLWVQVTVEGESGWIAADFVDTIVPEE